jgi:hypothetical protein
MGGTDRARTSGCRREQGRWMMAALLASAGGLGCLGQEDGDELQGSVATQPAPADAPSAPLDSTAPAAETSKALNLCLTRSDRVSTVTVTNGDWGSWASCPSNCPEGSFAYGLRLKVDPWTPAVFVDETAVNAVRLNCNNRVSGAWTANAESTVSGWGSWWDISMCPGGTNVPLVGGKAEYESPGHSDETTLNHLWGRCGATTASDLPVQGASGYGSWRTPVDCPTGTAVCGITTRVESNQGVLGDDTALGGVRYECCRFCPVGQTACGPGVTCLPTASCPSPVVR